MFKRIVRTITTLAAIAALAPTGVARASGTSTVYFGDGYTGLHYKVFSDGTGKTTLAGGGPGMPSYLLHNGIRWYTNEVVWDPASPYFGMMTFNSDSGATIYAPVNWGDIDIGID